MDVERLPSGKFETNELVPELTILAYNILRIRDRFKFCVNTKTDIRLIDSY